MQRWSHIALEQVLRSAARNRASATEAQYSALSLLARGERSRARTSYHVSGTSCPWTFCEPYNLQTSGLHSYGSDRSSLSSRVTATSRHFTDGQTEQPTRSFADAIQRLRQTQHRAKRRHALKKTVNAVSQEQQVAEPEPVNEDQRDIVTADASVASSRQVADVVRHPALVVTRNVEWGTVIFGFEQANQYTILNEAGDTVALLAEDLGGFGKQIGRQLLRTRRPFTATVFSPDGAQIIFRVRRPFYFINSTILVEDGAGEVVGEVHQRWHLWQRNYDLYAGRRQFAAINGSFLAWEFVLRDQKEGVLALIDRNFQGFGKEIFTDAGKYVIHFGQQPDEAAQNVANTIQAAHPDKPKPPVTAIAKLRTGVSVIPTQAGNQLEVQRPLGLSERMLCLAAAISIDYDYFSRHSSGAGGGFLGPFLFPMPMPPYPSEGNQGSPEGAEAPAEGAGASPEGAQGPTGAAEESPFPPEDDSFPSEGGHAEAPPEPEPFERDLGGDDFEGDFGDAGGSTEDGAASGWDMLKDIFGNSD